MVWLCCLRLYSDSMVWCVVWNGIVAPWFCLCRRKLYCAYCISVIGSSAKERKLCGISNILLSNMTNEFLEEEFGNQIAFVLWLMCSWKRNLGTPNCFVLWWMSCWKRNLGTKLFCVVVNELLEEEFRNQIVLCCFPSKILDPCHWACWVWRARIHQNIPKIRDHSTLLYSCSLVLHTQTSPRPFHHV
jgi:hypothetical protein